MLSGPVWLYQLWAFIVPGLLAKEKKWALIFIGIASPLFFLGVATAYYVLPKAIAVLLGFTAEGVANLQDINTFLSFMLRLMVVFGIAYLIPLLVLMLNIVGVVKASQLAKYRTLVIFGTFVFGAVATPSTDPFSMLALALPMSLLFLVAEVIAHILDRRKAKRIGAGGDELLATDKALRELSADSSPSTNGHAPERSQTMLEPSPEDLPGLRRAAADPMSRRVRLVVNPSSGKGRALELLPAVAGTLRDGGLDLSIQLSRDFDEARAMAERAVADGVDVLAVMGGDGMMHLGVNTVAAAHRAGDRRTTLGVIPAGTGNDLCRGLGLDPNDSLAGRPGGGRGPDPQRRPGAGRRHLRRYGAGHRLRRAGQPPGQRDGLAARVVRATPWPPWPSCGCSRRWPTG